MKLHLVKMLDAMRFIARGVLGLPRGAKVPDFVVRSYYYPDGKAIVRMRLMQEAAGRESVDAFLFGLSQEDGWSFFPEGTWYEASLLFRPEDGKKYKIRYNGLQQIQTFGTKDWRNLFSTLRTIVWPKMRALGYPAPTEYLFRAGISVDDSKPFTKKDPPIDRLKD